MPDYKTMYLLLLRETENALRLLIAAQRRCEDLYLEEEPEPLLFVLADAQDATPSEPEESEESKGDTP